MTFSQRLEELKKAQAVTDVLDINLSQYILDKIPSEIKLLCSVHARHEPLTISIWEYLKGTTDSARFSYQGGWVVEARGTFDDRKVESIRLVLEELVLEGK